MDQVQTAGGRRAFLAACGGLAAAALMPGRSWAATLAGQMERRLSFRNLHTGEMVRSVYWAEGRFVPDGLREIDHILRDFRTGEVAAIDRALLDQLVSVRSLLGLGPKQEIQIISGYRSHSTNAMLREQSGRVAKKSQHELGKAIDLRLSGIELSNLHKAALAMKAGGVGYYPEAHNNFVHLDTGRFRTW